MHHEGSGYGNGWKFVRRGVKQHDGANGWCRGPESNWLRPPFQGGALPMSYPGTSDLEIVGLMRSCVNSVKNSMQINVRNRRTPSSRSDFSEPRGAWYRPAVRRSRPSLHVRSHT